MTNKGVSLIEAMLTLGLVGVTLAIAASLMRIYTRSSRLVDLNGVKTQAVRAVLHGIRTETMGAVTFDSPAGPSATWSDTLRFSKVDGGNSSRLESFPEDWTPYDLTDSMPLNDFLLDVEYRESSGKLIRATRRATESAFTEFEIPPEQLKSFDCRLNPDETFELRIIIGGVKRDQTFTSKTLRRIR